MPTDLTERLAAWAQAGGISRVIATPVIEENADDLLPLLLSEPELVASLPDAVRLGVLNKRELAVMKLGEAAEAYAKADDEYGSSDGFQDPLIPGSPLHSALQEFDAALAEARALAPSPGATPAPPLEAP